MGARKPTRADLARNSSFILAIASVTQIAPRTVKKHLAGEHVHPAFAAVINAAAEDFERRLNEARARSGSFGTRPRLHAVSAEAGHDAKRESEK